MIDIQTVFICIMHTTLFYAVAYLVVWGSQKTYRGFGCWTLAAICNSCLYGSALLRLLPGEWIGVVSVGGVAFFLPLSTILRTDAILRFTKNRTFPWYVYLIPLVIIPLNIYLYSVQNIAMRYVFLMVLVIPFNYINCKTLFQFKSKTGRLLYICGGIFFLMRIVGLAFESIILFMHKEYVSIFQSPDMGSYLLFTLIAEVGIGLFFFMVNTQRSQEELLQANTRLENEGKHASIRLEPDHLFSK